LRAIKVEISGLLADLDADHDKDAELAELTERLSSLQYRHYNVCFDHDRMQQRLGELLQHVRDSTPEDILHVARFEAERGKASR
jgi:hypothetical protein